MLLGNIFISWKLFQIAVPQRGSLLLPGGIALPPTLLLECLGQIEPFHLHCNAGVVKRKQMTVMFQRSGTISETILCLRFRREGPAYSCLSTFFFFFLLGLPKLRNWMKVKIKESKFCFQLFAYIPLPVFQW